MSGQPLFDALKHTLANTGESLDALSRETPLLIVFLRHAGCPFCREALAQLQKERAAIESGVGVPPSGGERGEAVATRVRPTEVGTPAGGGVRIVLVHMTTDDSAKELFAKYGLDDVPRVADPQRKLYEAFELKRGTAGQVMGPRVWWKGFKTTILRGHLPGIPEGDVYQLPGTFLVSNGEIIRAFRSEDSSAHPDYAEFAACELPDS